MKTRPRWGIIPFTLCTSWNYCLSISRFICFTAAPDPPEIIKAILHTKSSIAIILWTNSADHGCFIKYNNIYYRIINERNREPWSKSRFQPNFIHQVQRYLLQVQSDKMYEVIVTAINSEGESSKELITPTIIGNVTKEPDQREYFAINRIGKTLLAPTHTKIRCKVN